jgi:BirA family biotin operon repressor/biotin-[acetyl-CoA-carboxylase] ligase
MALLDFTDQLDVARLREALAGSLIGKEIIVLEQTTSTNDVVFDKAAAGAGEGLVIFAEQQTAGRGQRSNRWHSAGGKGLWFSILLRPRLEVAQSGRLTDWAAHTLSRVFKQQLGLATTVKTPNDIYLENRKMAGILVEMRAQTGAPHLAIVGIGINVNQALDDFPVELRGRATSLAIALGRKIDRGSFASELLRILDRNYAQQFAQ